ncbi:hypothetical protein K490DRAFT_71520 [Saccharata proteae CBS 121410]|uniref:non-specific serine/threonine protein kinase n=1 Tax=Saccharata proteae CBS 121410 TaxID=1314787 RepID=A0A9P4LWN7_9PEZI|nr:hypothetical protein K490DRAFT_71520 [Saccharata proteae CBS 121410]
MRDHEYPGRAEPVTPPQSTLSPKVYECNVEYKRKLYLVTWSGTLSYPDLSSFPNIQHATVSPVQQSPKMVALWKCSTTLAYGAHGLSNFFPILKLSHPDEESMELMNHEFKMLHILADLPLSVRIPVPRVSDQPVIDQDRICGYQMEELYSVGHNELRERSSEIDGALTVLHKAGFSHGDISQGNIMVDSHNRIVLTDFSYSGQLGAEIPKFIPKEWYRGSCFTVDIDLERAASFK